MSRWTIRHELDALGQKTAGDAGDAGDILTLPTRVHTRTHARTHAKSWAGQIITGITGITGIEATAECGLDAYGR